MIEPEGPDAFISDSVDNHYRRGDVARYPWIGSVTSEEGYTAVYGNENELHIKYYVYRIPNILCRTKQNSCLTYFL